MLSFSFFFSINVHGKFVMRKMEKGLEVKGSGFGVSPRDGMPLDCVRKLCSNEKLEMVMRRIKIRSAAELR